MRRCDEVERESRSEIYEQWMVGVVGCLVWWFGCVDRRETDRGGEIATDIERRKRKKQNKLIPNKLNHGHYNATILIGGTFYYQIRKQLGKIHIDKARK